MHVIFDKLIKSSIEKCIDDFERLSREVFVGEDGKLIHPGEFGTYRERIIERLIRQFIPQKYDIGTGFIITKEGRTSTQCDLIIFDKENTPIIETDDQRFFPIESVACVIEVKSVLSKSKFKDALVTLSKIKELRNDVGDSPCISCKNHRNDPIDTKHNISDQIVTFLICEKIDFDAKTDIDDLFADIYAGIDKSLHHNMILSINDGCFLYRSDKDGFVFWPYRIYGKDSNLNTFIYPSIDGYKYEHLLAFINLFFMAISIPAIFFVDITNYLGPIRAKNSVSEKRRMV